LSINADKLDV